MAKKIFAISFLLPLMLAFCFEASADSKHKIGRANYPYVQNEKFVIRSLRTLHSAQVTYSTTSGGGNYGSLDNLRQADLIEPILASGEIYGYRFIVSKTDYTATTPARFSITATPRLYRKTGRRSFYIDENGEMRGADKNGGAATAADPIIIDECFPNEECAISDMRTLHSAQITYSATIGNGNFGTFNQLHAVRLISGSLAVGFIHGYNFTYTIVDRTATTKAFFKILAVPQNYGVTGVRSFYIAVDGVLRGADKNGAPADENDPPIDE